MKVEISLPLNEELTETDSMVLQAVASETPIKVILNEDKTRIIIFGFEDEVEEG